MGRKTDACMQFAILLYVVIQSIFMDQMLNGLLSELPIIYNYIVVSLTQPIPQALVRIYRSQWWEWWRAAKCHINPFSQLKTAKWHEVVPFSSPHITQSSYVNP